MEGLTEGRIVHYVLTAQDAQEVNRRRTSCAAIAMRMADGRWPEGAQAHIGNEAKAGDHCPMVIVRVWGTVGCVNGQVLLDGADTFWALSRNPDNETRQPGTWHWIEKA